VFPLSHLTYLVHLRCPRTFVVMRMRRQSAIRQVDAPAIEALAASCDGDEHRRPAVLRDTDRRGFAAFVVRPRLSRSGHAPAADGQAASQTRAHEFSGLL
jgi:hypothetical protein